MKFINSKLVVFAASLALCAGTAMAQDQTTQHPARGHGMHGHFMGGDMGLPLHELNLTDDQKAQVKQIFQNEKPTMKPLMQQEMAAHQQLIQLVTSGTFETAKAAAIAAQESQTHLQLELEHAKIASQIYQLLNADQKAKVAQIIAQHEQRMQERMQNREESAPPAQ